MTVIERMRRKKRFTPDKIVPAGDSLGETLAKNTAASANVLKELPGTVELEPVSDKDSVYYALLNDGRKEFKPYYAAHNGGGGGNRTRKPRFS